MCVNRVLFRKAVCCGTSCLWAPLCRSPQATPRALRLARRARGGRGRGRGQSQRRTITSALPWCTTWGRRQRRRAAEGRAHECLLKGEKGSTLQIERNVKLSRKNTPENRRIDVMVRRISEPTVMVRSACSPPLPLLSRESRALSQPRKKGGHRHWPHHTRQITLGEIFAERKKTNYSSPSSNP